MNIRRLRLVTIVAPLIFLFLVELFGIFVLRPAFGGNSVLRLLVLFGIMLIAVTPFSLWVFATIESQQREIAESAELLASVRGHAIFMLDPQGNVLTWSPAAEEIKGYSAQQIIGRNVAAFYRPEDVAQGLPEQLLRDAAKHGHAEAEGWRVRGDGSHFWAHVTSTVVRDERGRITGYTHVVRDMTERRRAEEAIQALNAQLEQRVEELGAANAVIVRHNAQLDAVNEAIRSISSAIDLSQVLQNITDAARRVVQARYAALGVSDENGRILQFITSGITTEQRAAIGELPQGHGLLGMLIKEGRPLRVAHIAQHEQSSGFPPNHPPMNSLLGVPIMYKHRLVGDLYMTDKIGADEFSQEDEEMLMLLANHAAVAIEHANLYEDVTAARDRLQVWNQELEAKVVERTREIERYSKELTTRVLAAQEEERKRIARELHDDTAQSLSTLMISIDLLEQSLPTQEPLVSGGLNRLRTLAKRTLDEVRAMSHDLRPTILDDFGLSAALEWYADEYTLTYDLPIDRQVEKVPGGRLAPEIELALFRIAQEALNNVGKHANATRAALSLTFPDTSAQLVVEDNGRGFELGKQRGPSKQGGLGMYGMRERAELLGATLRVDAAPNQGTRVTVTVPLTTPATEQPTPAHA